MGTLIAYYAMMTGFGPSKWRDQADRFFRSPHERLSLSVVVNSGTPKRYGVRDNSTSQRFLKELAPCLPALEKLADRKNQFDTDRIICTFRAAPGKNRKKETSWSFKVYFDDFRGRSDPLSKVLNSIAEYAQKHGKYEGEAWGS